MRRFSTWVLVAVVGVVSTSPSVPARETRYRKPARVAVPRSAVGNLPTSAPYRAALLVEADTGRVLFDRNAELEWQPASMVKMMVALLVFEAVRDGKARLDEPVPVSASASRTVGSRVFLRVGESFAMTELLRAMLVASANDAAVAISEFIAGDVDTMLRRMNLRARELGMTHTVYRSVNGLPPRRGGKPDVTTASDLALLARKLLDYPEVLEYSSARAVPFRNGRMRLRNTNQLIGRMQGVDGLKTGYYRLAGFNLTATASRDGMRLISVILGCPNVACRFRSAEQLLEWGFAHYSKMALVRAGEPLAVEIPVANGTSAAVRPIAAETATYLVRKDQIGNLQVRFQLPTVVAAPVSKNQPLGEIIIRDEHGVLDVIPAIAPGNVDAGTYRGIAVSN